MKMLMLRRVAAVWCALLMLAVVPARAGDTPGNVFVQDTAEMFEGLIADTGDQTDALVDAAAAKIAQLDERGASSTQIERAAEQAIAKVRKLEIKGQTSTQKWGKKFNIMLINWDEPELIDQLTVIAAQRAGVLNAIDTISDNAIQEIEEARDAVLPD